MIAIRPELKLRAHCVYGVNQGDFGVTQPALSNKSELSELAELTGRMVALIPDKLEPGVLYIVSTPIGNLADISLRALSVLSHSSAIYCEDTRESRTLLSRYGIRTPTVVLHEHNEASVAARLVARLQQGEAIALISDAGTPLISDPGMRAVDAVIEAGLRVVPIPGASAVLAALVAGGMPALPFTMFGFLARKGAERTGTIEKLSNLGHTAILFESPRRLSQTLRELSSASTGERRAAVARELTKKFEDIRRGTLDELAAYYEGSPPKGEIVILLAAVEKALPLDDVLRAAAINLREQGFRPRDIVQMLMDQHSASRNVAYRIAHDT